MKKILAIPFGILVLSVLLILGLWDGCKKKAPPPDISLNLYDNAETLVTGEFMFSSGDAPEAQIWWDAKDGKMKFKGDADVAFEEFFKGFQQFVDEYVKEHTKTKIVERIVEKEVVVYKEIDVTAQVVPNTLPRTVINLLPGEKYKFVFENKK